MSRHVKFGVRMHQHGYDFDDLKRVWTQADRLGYHSATLYDLLNAPALECWTALSALDLHR
jgi:alkanesulfonate monooxygenase SsuD/methylene tetrahydromethanopterin reductase-like flavin-dependent oxidoreductase (luciferase family)